MMNAIQNFFDNFNLNINKSEDTQRYYQKAKVDAIHCYQSIEKYLSKDEKYLKLGGVFICLPAFCTKIMILLQLSLVVLQALPMNCEIRF